MNKSYQGFARIYDEMMAERNYQKWAEYVCDLAQERGIGSPDRMLDLACGTGSFLREMAGRNWSVYGVDSSVEMLGVAQQKLSLLNHSFLLFQQDMRELDLGLEFPLITCLCDSLNYLLSTEDLLKTFQRIKRHLTDGGLLIADMNSEYRYRLMLGNDSFAETFPDSAYIWENYYDPETRICRMEIDFFLRAEGELFRHIPEIHLQRSFYQLEIAENARAAGFREISFWQAFTKNRLDPEIEIEELACNRPNWKEKTGSNPYEEGRMFLVLR